MEAGFFSEEKCSVFHSQADDLIVDDGSIFDRLVLPVIPMQFDSLSTLWDQMEDDNGVLGGTSGCGANGMNGNRKEDFHKMFNDWQEHLSSLQVLDVDKLRSDMPDMFSELPIPQQMDDDFSEECTISIKEEIIFKKEPEEALSPDRDDMKEEGEINSDAEEDEAKLSKAIVKDEPNDSAEEESVVDVETVGEKIPVLEAGDVTTLLEQFEASEAVNTTCVEAEQQSDMSHQNIRDALPKEFIDRIKASTRKKPVSILPIPTKKSSRAAKRVQDAAKTMSHKKSKSVSTGESVQLDHDYCSGIAASEGLVPPPQHFYQADKTDYTSSYSRLPDYYVALAPKKTAEPSKADKKDWNEKNSKKDSGLESGDVSDASEEVPPPPTPPSTKTVSMVSVLKRNRLPSSSVNPPSSNSNTVPVPAIYSLSSNNSSLNSNSSSANSIKVLNSSSINTESVQSTVNAAEPVLKRKLNIEEYRSRRREEQERDHSKEGSRTCSQYSSSDSSQNCSESTSANTGSAVKGDQNNDTQLNHKVMHNVEVQATPEQHGVNGSVTSKTKAKASHETTRRRREYRTRRVSSSSSSSSPASRTSKHRSSRRPRKNSHSGSRSGTSQTKKRSIWSRSPSSSSNTSCSTCSSFSRSRSHSRSRSRSSHHSDTRRSSGGKWGSRSLWRTKHRFTKSYSNNRDSYRRHRTSSWVSGNSSRDSAGHNSSAEWTEKEKLRQVEERRVIYVGRIEEGTTKAHLRERFSVFGPIIDISVHFREHGDNYGFVTFAYKVDAYEAVEHGNDDPLLSRYDLSFGGRRAFCKQRYADLDGERGGSSFRGSGGGPPHRPDASFDLLLREAQAHLNKRSSV